MNIFKKFDTHTKLVDDMSDRVGAKWSDLMAENPSMVKDYLNAVMTCTHCKKVGECQGWLDANDTADQTPEYCLNKGLLEALAKD